MSVARHRSLILVVIGTTLLGLMAEWLAWGQRQATVTPTTEMVLVTRMVDGDTLALNTGERVRLIGVDTPEMKHPKRPVEAFGKEATAFTKPMVEGKCVRLEYDQQRQDKYGRILAYV
jgi:micrococcal nuclease